MGAYGDKPDDTPLGAHNPDAPPAQQFRLAAQRFLYRGMGRPRPGAIPPTTIIR